MMTADLSYIIPFELEEQSRDRSFINPTLFFGIWNHHVRAFLRLPLAAYEAAGRPILFWGIGLQTNPEAAFL